MELAGDELRVAQGAGQERHQAGGHRLDHRDAEELVHRGARHDRRPDEQLEVALAVQVADVHEAVARSAPRPRRTRAGRSARWRRRARAGRPRRRGRAAAGPGRRPPGPCRGPTGGSTARAAVRRRRPDGPSTTSASTSTPDREHRRAGVHRSDQVGVAVVRRSLEERRQRLEELAPVEVRVHEGVVGHHHRRPVAVGGVAVERLAGEVGAGRLGLVQVEAHRGVGEGATAVAEERGHVEHARGQHHVGPARPRSTRSATCSARVTAPPRRRQRQCASPSPRTWTSWRLLRA